MAFLEISASKSYTTAKGRKHVLDHVDLSVEEGEFVSVVGYSGSGKTTLINLAAGLIAPTAGRVTVDGAPVQGFVKGASIVFQNYSLLPWFSAIENVRLGVEAAFPAWSVAKQRAQAERYLEMVGLKAAFEKRPGQLSGGMRQRVSIARAFATEPRILFLDEPFGALDALTRANLQQELLRMCSEAGRPVTTLMITNNVEEAILLSSRIVPLSRGPRAVLGPAIEVSHEDDPIHVQARIVEFLTGFTHSTGERAPRHSAPPPMKMMQEVEL
ncbi:MAG: ABC transporter ATP-binding protein [Acidobacteriota bacterium]|nr:ABC transporter ATP-binding protein [Acidobacteriota bacterium]